MTRDFTDIDRLAEAYTDDLLELSPLTRLSLGAPMGDRLIDDFSPEGWAAKSGLRRSTLVALRGAHPQDDVDAVTVDAMVDSLSIEEDLYEAGQDLASLNNIASPLQEIRDTLDLLPTASDEDWALIGRYLQQVDDALAGWHVSLTSAAARGHVAARRQVEACLAQIGDLTSESGPLARLSSSAAQAASPSVAEAVTRGAQAAAEGYRAQRQRLVDDILPVAREEDAVGPELYALHSRRFLGTRVDLSETYAWGQTELEHIRQQMHSVAHRILPGASLAEVYEFLDDDPRYRVEGTDALREWMQSKADAAIADLADVHFDIPEQVRRIECMIAPSTTGGIYYTGPSEDFSRAGRMWWSVPAGVTRFGTWRELTTVYHEGVPGHHLQIGQTAARSELLNRWRRLMSWVSGHGEGWALYAERLMADFGYLDDDADRLGMLDAQALRAARVVVDVGLHCGFEAPESVGGGAWTYDKAWTFLRSHVSLDDATLRFELGRYLGWPGQAPSYKLGEREWLRIRDAYQRAQGEAFSLRDFHRRALDLGSVGLDTMRRALVQEVD